MTPELEKARLFKRLKRQNKELAGRIAMVRTEVEEWLQHIIQFFPHYPSHGADHSDRIVAQLSNLLFRGTKPVVPFSAGEIYCLVCAAYLHDVGMVVSNSNAAAILASEDWITFVSPDNKGHDPFQVYERLRAEAKQEVRKGFFADLALRQLIAEFIRTLHHDRVRAVLELHPFLRQLVDAGDSVAFETIADICLAHGMSDSDISDESRYPEERDVLGGKANVRFLARLLRIGDLLDMGTKRAAPMSAIAAAPVPLDSVPHWQQFSTKKHENVSPEKIEFRFECQDQETHRVLRDWFGRLESEVHSAGLEQLHAAWHDGWRAPRCVVNSQATADLAGDKPKPTIIVKPTKAAKYAFHDWRLELDHDKVMERLIYDAYDNPTVFVRELIQNALDATRCQMYADHDLQSPRSTSPDRPTKFPAEFRERYPVLISLTEEEVRSSPDAPPEKRRVFSIEDHGTGMDEQIITRYFLQVGRSYYQSSEFRARFKFVPTSRFGVGFLSVFAVSGDITVDSARLNDKTNQVQGLRLRLRGPRNYLLTERWTPFEDRGPRWTTGTRIRVVLDNWNTPKSLTELVQQSCVAVEVPIVVREYEKETIIRSERLADKTILCASRMDPNGRFILRAFDLDRHGVEGQIAVVAYEDENGEGWCDCWSTETGLDNKRIDKPPRKPDGFRALHGVDSVGRMPERGSELWAVQADLRTAAHGVAMGRSFSPRRFCMGGHQVTDDGDDTSANALINKSVMDASQDAVADHLKDCHRAKGDRGAIYIGNVLSGAFVRDSWRDDYPGTVVTWLGGDRRDMSVTQILATDECVVALWTRISSWEMPGAPALTVHPKQFRLSWPTVSFSDVPQYAHERLASKFRTMRLCSVERCGELWLFGFSRSQKANNFERISSRPVCWVAPLSFPAPPTIRLSFGETLSDELTVLNRESPIMKWLLKLRAAATSGHGPVSSGDVEGCWQTAIDTPWKMDELIAKWSADARVPEPFKPPTHLVGDINPWGFCELHSRSTL